MTRLESREIGHSRRVPAKVVRLDVHGMVLVLANAPGQIVMPVDDWLFGEDVDRAREEGVRGRARLRLLGV